MAHLIFPVGAYKDELRGGLEIPAHWVGFIFLFYESCWKFGKVKVYGQEMWLFERLEIQRHPFCESCLIRLLLLMHIIRLDGFYFPGITA